MLANVVPEVNQSEICSAVNTFFILQVFRLAFSSRVSLRRTNASMEIEAREVRKEYVLHRPSAAG